jgi:hypothetical protein
MRLLLRAGVASSVGSPPFNWQTASTPGAAAVRFASATMGQKSLDSFLVKQPGSAQSIGTAAAGAAVATAASDGGGTEPVHGNAAAQQAALPPPAEVPQAQANEQQLMRAHANRNMAVAKQVGSRIPLPLVHGHG